MADGAPEAPCRGAMVGVVVSGGQSAPLATLGIAHDVAMAPFAVRYRLWDFARATLRNSGVRPLGPLPSLGPAPAPRRDARARLLDALKMAARVARTETDGPLVVLVADHVLDADLRPVLSEYRAAGADLGLLCVPAGGAPADACVIDGTAGGTVRLIDGGSAETGPLALAWTGDVVVRAESLPRLLATLEHGETERDADHIASLACAHRVVAHDLHAAAPRERRPYWHEPSTIEAYYGAHMDLCTHAPRLDLYDPGWPVLGTSDGLPPAKVVAGDASHAGQALDALLGDGTVIRGGSVIRSVVGRGVLVDVGAEIEDSLLLDGCRVGRGARIRRAVVGTGATVGEGEHIGYDDGPMGGPALERRQSGLTVVPPTPRALAAPSTRR
jgi:glucose-1-phosphate adenylyltransferase